MYLRSILCLCALLVAGCEQSTPSASTEDYTAVIAQQLALATLSTAPNPAPPVTPGFCENCGGDGVLGDGTTKLPCPVCGGDGRTDNALPPVRKLCKCDLDGGKCECSPCTCNEKKKAPPVDPTPKINSYQDAVKAFDGTCIDGSCNSGSARPAQSQQSVEYQNNAPRRGLFGRRRGG